MKQLKFSLLIIICLLSGKFYSQAQQAEVVLDTNAILVGDQVDLKLNLRLPDNYHFHWPQFGDTLTGGLEIVRRTPVDTGRIDGLLNVRQVLTVTAFDSGYYVIPPVNFRYGTDPAALTEETETEPYLLNVFTMEVDTTQAIRPIKGPISVGYSFAEIWPWIMLAILAIGVIILVIYFYRQRKKQKPFVFIKPKPKLPPHETALQELEKLKKEKLWQQGKIKEYHTRVAGIVREYIEEQFRVPAVEMTTWDTMQSVQKLNLKEHDKNMLRWLLETADLVKFAKARPLPGEHEKSMEYATEFVRNTKPDTDNKPGLSGVKETETVEQAN
ncbi:MAG: hypothetical protein ACLFPE_10860 [Bacteroidales bacterium]